MPVSRIRKKTPGKTIKRAKGYKITRNSMMGKIVYFMWKYKPNKPNKGWHMYGGPYERLDSYALKFKWKKVTGKELQVK